MRGNFRTWRMGMLAMALCLSAESRAAEEPAQPSALSTAQQEFKHLKDSTAPNGNARRLGLPTLEGLNPGQAEPVPYQGILNRESKAADKKSSAQNKNWLVDAVMKEQKRDGKAALSSDDEDEVDEDEDLDPLQKLIVEQLRGPDEEDADQIKEDSAKAEIATETAVLNPLTDYMSGWISARDRDLLLGDVKPRDGSALISRFSDPAGSSAAPEHAQFFFMAPADSPAGLAAAPENPYLDLAPLQQPLEGSMPLNFEAPPKPITPIYQLPDAMPTVTPPKRLNNLAPPGLSKPEEDARYFPQLKRF